MTREKAIDLLGNLIGMVEDNHNSDYDTALKIAIKALGQDPCADCVSRQAVLAETYNWSKDEFLRVTNPFDYLRKRINALPPVTPAEKVGRWIKDDITERSRSAYKHKCDRCGAYHRAMYDYCPSCGAKMEGAE